MKGCDANANKEFRKIIAELRDAVAQAVFIQFPRQIYSKDHTETNDGEKE